MDDEEQAQLEQTVEALPGAIDAAKKRGAKNYEAVIKKTATALGKDKLREMLAALEADEADERSAQR